jgi:hypothetical protein
MPADTLFPGLFANVVHKESSFSRPLIMEIVVKHYRLDEGWRGMRMSFGQRDSKKTLTRFNATYGFSPSSFFFNRLASKSFSIFRSSRTTEVRSADQISPLSKRTLLTYATPVWNEKSA